MEKKKKKKKKNKNKKNQKITFVSSFDSDSKFSLFEVIIIILISVIFGIIIGYLLTYGNSNLSRVRSDTNLGEVVSTYNNIVDNYYGKVDENKLSESAIKGMISSLEDPYSLYLDENTTDSFNESVDGSYTGIGINVEFDGEFNRVVSINKDGPAYNILKEDDIILDIDGNDCSFLYPEDLTKLIDGKAGTTLDIKVRRGEEELLYSIKREIIEIENVTSKIINKNIGYIKINIFSSNSYDQFVKNINKLEKKKIKYLIIDVRDNPGGHLAQAQKILELFFPKKTVLYQIERNGKMDKIYSKNNDKRSYPVVLLINGETASSAEVLVACFQDNYKQAKVLGVNSYGKGNVQKSLSLSNGTSIKFTIEKWYTPEGLNVSDKGITPDIEVEQDPIYYSNYLDDDDRQLQEAINILKKSL